MKKNFLLCGIIILAVIGLGVAGFWYWYSEIRVPSLQTVALDNPEIDSFDDVCTENSDYTLTCLGNIEKFDCIRSYQNINGFPGLEPQYPIISCEKSIASSQTGVYTLPGNPYVEPTYIDYIVIKNGAFQLAQSIEEVGQIFQPIESVDEAEAYFSILGKGLLVLDQGTLSKINAPDMYDQLLRGARFNVPLDTIQLSQVTETPDGYLLTPYSGIPVDCVDEVYLYTFLLKRDGQLIEQNKQLIWEVIDKPSCVY